MTPRFTGWIVEWDKAKGYGWMDSQGQRVFLHIRDFAARHKTPEVGDVIRFIAGTDLKGRTCAKAAEHVNDGGRVTSVDWFRLAILLLLPAAASSRLSLPPWVISAYASFISLVTYGLYARDKKRARAKEWRTSESVLHLFELAGGWPGAFVAQRRLRHKCSKLGYRIVFWLIVLTYQFIAISFLFDWKFFRTLVSVFK